MEVLEYLRGLLILGKKQTMSYTMTYINYIFSPKSKMKLRACLQKHYLFFYKGSDVPDIVENLIKKRNKNQLCFLLVEACLLLDSVTLQSPLSLLPLSLLIPIPCWPFDLSGLENAGL